MRISNWTKGNPNTARHKHHLVNPEPTYGRFLRFVRDDGKKIDLYLGSDEECLELADALVGKCRALGLADKLGAKDAGELLRLLRIAKEA